MLSSTIHSRLTWCLIGSAILTSGCASPRLISRMTRKGDQLQVSNGTAAPPQNGFYREFVKGRAAEQSGKLEEARGIYQQLLSQYPDRADCYHRLGVVSDRMRRFGDAQEYFSEALRLEPQNAEMMNDLGYCFYLQGKLEKAESALLKAAALSPKNSRYQNNLGMVYGHLGRLDESLTHFRQAGSESDAQFNLAFVHAAKGDFDAAQMSIERALALDPGHKKALRARESFAKVNNGSGVVPTSYEEDSNTRWIPYVEGGQNNGAETEADAMDAAFATHHMSAGSRAALQSRSRAVKNTSYKSLPSATGNPGETAVLDVSG